jgi:hypothetical protein
MGVDLDVVFAATVTAEEAVALPARLNRAPAVVAACRAYYAQRKPSMRGLELEEWAWDDHQPAITAPSVIVEAWASPYVGSVWLSGTLGLLCVKPDQIRSRPGPKLSGFAADYEGCQAPIRQVCRALVRELGADRVLYLPDSGDWPSEVGDLYDTPFDEALARLTAWGPPVSAIGALGYGRAVRSGFHYADGALRRADGTPVPEAEIMPGGNRIHAGGIVTYYDGTPVPPEELARPDLRGGFAYYVDDFRDLA